MGKFKDIAIAEDSALIKHIKKDWPGAIVTDDLLIKSANGTELARVIGHGAMSDMATGTFIITSVEYNVEPNIITNPNASPKSKFSGIVFTNKLNIWDSWRN